MNEGKGFALLTIVMLVMVLLTVRSGMNALKWEKKKVSKTMSKILWLAVGWLTYVFLLQSSGVFLDKSLPPKMPLVLVFPVTVICIISYRKLKDNQVLAAIKPQYLALLQSFRIPVEIFIYLAFLEGVMPQSASFDGYNFDIVMGALGLVLGLTIFKNVEKYRGLIRAYNIVGIVMILIVAAIIVSSYYNPALWNSDQVLVQEKFFQFPYLLLAGFLAPLGIYMHVLSLAQMKGRFSKK